MCDRTHYLLFDDPEDPVSPAVIEAFEVWRKRILAVHEGGRVVWYGSAKGLMSLMERVNKLSQSAGVLPKEALDKENENGERER